MAEGRPVWTEDEGRRKYIPFYYQRMNRAKTIGGACCFLVPF